MRLRTAGGDRVPVQTWPIGYWPDGSLKWSACAIGAAMGVLVLLHRLGVVASAGQYELERIGAENQRSQSGLDLGVIDHYNGTRRSVKTLSGGESFKASLALALGLSDEVQSAAGGIRLDTLFLDEGFGSLDDESLEQAIRVLAGLTEGDRLVGIISHVAALKERIDKQVVVKKARSGGSTVELVV